jgi:predicted dehydrogenase
LPAGGLASGSCLLDVTNKVTMEESTMIRVGMIGCGKIARAHAQGYAEAADLAQVVVCCDEWSEENAMRTAQPFGADISRDWKEVINRADVDAISICMPHWQHVEIAIAAAQAGKHILVEKPMAMNLAEARRMVEAAEQAGVVLMVGQNQRWMADHVAVKELLDQGAIGRVMAVRFDCNQFLKRMYPEGSWMFSREKTGGGMVICTAVHKIDLLRHFFGEVKHVSSFQGHTGLNYNMDNEDIAAILMEFENGIIAEGFYLFAAYKVPIPTTTGELTVIYGDKGIIHNVMGWHIYSTEIPEYSGGVTRLELPQNPYHYSLHTEVRHFLECIRDGATPLTSGRDNLGTMAVIDAVYRAHEEKAVIQVEH